MNVLAVETSCDDTSVAIVNSDARVLACIVANQDQSHGPFGGIVPEIASRNHSHFLLPMIEQAMGQAGLGWHDIHGLAVTNRPGLVGSLIVGLVTVKTLALVKELPFIGVHHIEGHIVAPFLQDDNNQGADFCDDEFLALIVSGGHTSLYHVRSFGNYHQLGATVDDAAGEAFDKFAKLLGLPYPGGVHIDRLALGGNGQLFPFPRPLLKQGYNFSFSGLKAAGQRLVETLTAEQLQQSLPDIAASYQRAIIDVLVYKVKKAVVESGIKKLVVSGGVSGNSLLRSEFTQLAEEFDLTLAIPPLRYCTDNAAMIGLAGLKRLQRGETSMPDLGPLARDEL